MIRQPPAVRFQAERSNALWHFDMSPSDLKHLKAPPWLDPDRAGAPTLMLFSVVDDRSGVPYQEHRCVYGRATVPGVDRRRPGHRGGGRRQAGQVVHFAPGAHPGAVRPSRVVRLGPAA